MYIILSLKLLGHEPEIHLPVLWLGIYLRLNLFDRLTVWRVLWWADCNWRARSSFIRAIKYVTRNTIRNRSF